VVAVCEEVCNGKNIFDDNKSLVVNINSMADAVEIASRPADVAVLEERLKEWMRRVQEVHTDYAGWDASH